MADNFIGFYTFAGSIVGSLAGGMFLGYKFGEQEGYAKAKREFDKGLDDHKADMNKKMDDYNRKFDDIERRLPPR